MKGFTLLALSLVALLVVACAPVAPPATPMAPAETPAAEESVELADIVDTAMAAGNFTTLAAALDAAGLVETLKGEGPFTVFAPTDEAFAALPEGTVESLLADPSGALTEVLLYHVVSGKVMASDVVGLDGQQVETVGGAPITVSVSDGTVMINDATVIAADVEASNGVIHVIDKVLLPPTEEAMPEKTGPEMADIVDTAVAAGNFTTLVTALQAAGLVDTLKGEGPFTVFAPTDEAFAALPEGTVESLLADPSGALTQVLLYHVVSGKVMAADAMALDGQQVETVSGAPITVSVSDGKVMINDATVIAADMEASNGVIHAIDKVLLPPTE
ncbi:beta-Ig-H3/fasciclin [Litorilinea aerophila]|nr:beta-Ig-H3/fasciclin [Litorilinea aerophila]